MKKLIGLSFVLVFSANLFAQVEQIQNKNGVDIMPEAGEFAIGVNAVPVLNYIGDLFGYTGSNGAMGGNKFVDYFAANTLFGKYMLTDRTAIRGHFRIGQYNATYNNDIFDDTQNDPNMLVQDTYSSQSSFYNIGVGYEFRRGKTRLRGIYGGEIMYQFARGVSRDYTYGNAFGNGNPAPTATTWTPGGTAVAEGPLAERVMSVRGSNYNGFGARAFAGVEYYIAPKICVGTEFGWSIMAGTNGSTSTKVEFWDPTAEAGGVATFRETTTASSNSLIIDTDNFGGALYFMFYF
jgi:hypothetical protein